MICNPRHRFRWIQLTLALGCAVAFGSAVACSDEADLPPVTMMGTGNNQPSGSGGGMNSSSGATVNPAAGASMGAMPGASGSNGAAEAPGMGAGRTDMSMGAMGAANGGGSAGASAGAAGSTGMAPACTSTVDTDGDGTSDCLDGCPQDANKLEAGVCGCGVRDTDVDFDGALDCQEMCPGDPAKTAPGACGCGRSDADTDGDGTLDCNDGCPRDAARTAPGTCGCGAANTLALCLRHRYSFNGNGAVATDSVGDADGDIIGATLAGNGTLVLAGVASDQYVELPPGLISELGASATVETWVTWTGAGAPWQRIFDFGSSELPAGQQGTGLTYLFLTPTNSINNDLRVAFTTAGPPQERVVNATTPLPGALATHVAVVINGPGQTLAMYQNGALIGTAPTADTTLAALNDVNNWLGRSQFAPDEEFQGVLDEVRIHSAARSAAQIAADFAAGPNNLPAQ